MFPPLKLAISQHPALSPKAEAWLLIAESSN
jgi:hypothetical protein